MPAEKTEFRLAPKAADDMETVWVYSVDRWGQDQATRYIDSLVDAFSFLASNPGAGAACDSIREGYRRYPVVRHVVYYQKTLYGIAVMRVLHDRMLPTRHL